MSQPQGDQPQEESILDKRFSAMTDEELAAAAEIMPEAFRSAIREAQRRGRGGSAQS